MLGRFIAMSDAIRLTFTTSSLSICEQTARQERLPTKKLLDFSILNYV